MLRAEGEVEEERAIRSHRHQIANPADRFVDEVFAEVITLFWSARWQTVLIVARELGVEVVGFTIEKPVVTIEALLQRPVVVRTGGRTLLHRCQVPLACAQRGVVVLLEHLGHRCCTRRDASTHVRKACVPVRNTTHSHRVMIATGEQRCARWRTQRRRVETGELCAA